MESGPLESFDLAEYLTFHRSDIIRTWIKKLTAEVEPYSKRPLEELKTTITDVVDANYHVLVSNDFRAINQFIDNITVMRLKAGFLLSDVQKAFEFYRTIVTDLLMESRLNYEDLQQAVKKINQCLAYTTHRFSNFFQDMHQKKILEQNKMLEQMVKKRTAALEESEKKYKILVEEIDDGYFVIQDDVIVFANPAFCHMHGYNTEDITGKKFIDFVAQPDKERMVDIISASHPQGIPTPASVYRRSHKSGDGLPTELHGKITRYDHKISTIGICRDITDRVKMERMIRRNERMAYIGQIAASLSHEIRNPMSAVKLNLQILKKNEHITGYDQRRVELSLSEVIRLDKILNELLDFAKPVQLNKTYFNMQEVIRTYLELLEMKFMEKDLAVKTLFDENSPMVWGDSEKIGQAVINILINAIESSEPSSEITVRYELTIKGHTGFANIIIDDEGAGFDEKTRRDMFKPFFTTKTKGVGLGLANVKRIIEAHQGAIFVEEKKPKGASFTLMLPTQIRNKEG